MRPVQRTTLPLDLKTPSGKRPSAGSDYAPAPASGEGGTSSKSARHTAGAHIPEGRPLALHMNPIPALPIEGGVHQLQSTTLAAPHVSLPNMYQGALHVP